MTAEDRNETKRRRKGCGCLLRGPLYLLLVLVILASGAYLFLQSGAARERAARLLEARLSEYFERNVEVGEISWTLFPLNLELHDVVIPSPDPETPPFARVPELSLQVTLESWADWRQPVVEVDRVHVREPRLHVVMRPDGTNNLPEFGQERDGEGRVEVRMGSLAVQDGALTFNEIEIPLELEASSVLARFQGVGADVEGVQLDGRLTAQDLQVVLPEGERYAMALSAQALFGSQRIELHRALLSGPDLQARLAGVLIVPEEDRRLELDVTASGGVDLVRRLGYMEPDTPVAGAFEFDGGLLWRPEGWSVRGSLTSDRLVVADQTFVDLDGTLRIVPEALRYAFTGLTYAEGEIAGLVLANLDRPDGAPLPIQVDVSLEGLELRALIAELDLPLEGLQGRLGGEVSYRFTTDDPMAGSGWADLRLTSARGRLLGPGLSLGGQVPLEIEDGTLRSRAVRLVTPSGSQVVHAEGAYDLSATAGELRWRLSTSDVGQLTSLLPEDVRRGEPGEGPPAWLPTAGTGEARGVVRLRPGTFRVETSFELADAEAPGLSAPRLEGSMDLTSLGLQDLVIEAAGDGGALMVTGSVPFEEGVGRVPFSLAVDAASWPSDERLGAWLPFELPLEGPVSGELQLSGSPDALRGSVGLTVEPARLAGFEAELLRAELRFDPERLVVEEGRVRTAAGTVTARGTVGIESGELDLVARAEGLDLGSEPFSGYLAGDVSGRVSLDAGVEGTLEAPRVRATVESRDLTVAGRSLGEAGGGALLQVAWDGRDLQVEGSLPGLLQIEGGGLLTPERADLEIGFTSEHVGRLAEVAAPTVPDALSGSLRGVLAVSGDFERPDELLVGLRLPHLVLRYQDRTITNVEPVVIRLGEQALEVESLFLQELGTGSELFAQGSLGLQEPRPLDFRLQGSLSTEWVELAAPGLEMDGTFDVLATVGGTLEEPRLNGQGELHDARLVAEGFPQSLEDLDAVVLFYPDQVVLDHLNARVGGGTLQASGRVGLYGSQGLDYRLQAQVEAVTLRYPEGFWIRADAALALVSTPDGRLIRGTVELARAFYLKDVEASLFQLLRQALRAERLEVAETGEFERTTQLAVNIEAPAGAVQVRNNLADLQGSANLTVHGSLARPVLFGEVEFERGGTLVYADNEFEVERARISFANPARITPVIDMVATTDVRQYDVTLNLSGRIDDLQVQVSSDPPLSDLDVVALLTTGRAPGRTALVPGSNEALGAQAAQQFLAGQAATAVAERVGTLFGFDRFRISPVGGEAGGALAGVGVTVGKRLSKDVFVTYTEQSTAPEGSLLQVEWQVDENLTLLLTATGDENYRLDARWDRRY